MSHLNTLAYSATSKSKRQLMVRSFANGTDVTWQISGRNSAGDDIQALITTTGESAVAVAVAILKELDPAKLSPRHELDEKFPVGSFIRYVHPYPSPNDRERILKVVPWDEEFQKQYGNQDWDQGVPAMDTSGQRFIPDVDLNPDKHFNYWEPVEVSVTTKTVEEWEVK